MRFLINTIHTREQNPSHMKCKVQPTRIELVTSRLLSVCSTN